MATARMATGNVLGVITDVSATISNISNTISGSVGILNDMVQNLKNKRMEGNLVEMDTFRANLLNDASVDATKREEAIRAYIGEDKVKQEVFNKTHDRLSAKFAEYDKLNKD